MAVQKRPDSACPANRVSVENQRPIGEQERQHIDIEICHETFYGQCTLIAALGIQFLLGGVHGRSAQRHRTSIGHAFTPWGAALTY